MAVRTRTVRDEVVRADRDPEGDGTTFAGAFELDRFNERQGKLLEVDYGVFLTIDVTGGLINGAFTNALFGSALGTLGIYLDPAPDDGLLLDADTELVGGPGAVQLLPGSSNTPVTFTASQTSGTLAVPAADVGDFAGSGRLRVGYEGFSSVLASGDPGLGSQSGSFVNANTSRIVVEYTYREAVRGSDRGNRIEGTAKSDSLVGLGGDDRLDGGNGNDALYGDGDEDRLYGGRGADKLYGGADDDELYGGAGRSRDVLDGGRGDDELQGDGGGDMFVFARNGGTDRVEDWGDGDRLDFRRISGLDRGDLRFRQDGDDLRIGAGAGTTVVLEDTDRGDLDRGDFLF